MTTSGEQYILRMIVDVKNDQALSQLTKDIRGSGEALKTTNRQMATSAKGSRQLGFAFQSAGYQVTDFFVQVEGGVSATRALSQQLPQLLAGFNILNPAFALTTAGLATLAALLPTITRTLGSLSDETVPLAEAMKDLNDAASGIGTTFSQADFTAWLRNFAEIDKAQRDALVSLKDYEQEVLRLRLNTAVDSLGGGVDVEAPEVGFGRSENARLLQYNRELREQAEALGLTTKEFRAFNAERAKLLQSGFTDSDALGAMQEIVYGAQTGDEVNARLAETVKQMTELRNAFNRLNDLRDLDVNDALQPIETQFRRRRRGRGRTGLSDEEREEQRRLKALERERAQLIELANAYEVSLLPATEQYRLELEKLNSDVERLNLSEEVAASLADRISDKYRRQAQAVRESQYELTVAEELAVNSFQSFERNFQTFVDGVAQGTANVRDLFKNMAASIVADLLRIYLTQQLTGFFFGGLGSAANQSTAGIPTSLNPSAFAKGGAFSNGVQMFAKGGVVSNPTLFPMARGMMGMMGEAGSEAIIPLTRNSNGDLGVGGSPVNVTVNNNAPGVSVDVQQDDTGLTIELVRDAIASDINQGGNAVASAIQNSFGIQRRGI